MGDSNLPLDIKANFNLLYHVTITILNSPHRDFAFLRKRAAVPPHTKKLISFAFLKRGLFYSFLSAYIIFYFLTMKPHFPCRAEPF